MLYYTVTCTRKRWLLLYLVMIYLHSTLGWVEQARKLERKLTKYGCDGDISWTLFFEMGNFLWTLSKGNFSWTLFGDFSWTCP